MPVNNHLQRMDITDFTPGVFGEANLANSQLLMPQNGFAKMLNYIPKPQGGLRAMYAIAETLSCTGRVTPHQEAVTGIFARGNSTTDKLLLTYNGTDHKARLYRMDGTNSGVVWHVPTNGTSGAATSDTVGPSEVLYFVTSAPLNYYVIVSRIPGATGSGGIDWQGVNKLQYVLLGGAGDDTFSNIATYFGPIAASGDRLLMGDGTLGYRVRYTNVGTLVDSTEFRDLDASIEEAGIRGIASMAPSDLLIMRGGSPWIQGNGDIASTSFAQRNMSSDHTGRAFFQTPVSVPGGVAFIEPGGHVYVTDGRSFNDISSHLPAFGPVHGSQASPVEVESPGSLSFINGLLFAPHGRVYNWETSSWFTIDEDTAFTDASHTTGDLFLTNVGLGSAVKRIDMFQGDNAVRSSTGTIQTASFTDQGGKNVEIREVELALMAIGSQTDVTVSLVDGTDTVVGTPQTITNMTAGRQILRFLFPSTVKAKYLGVRVSTDGGSAEAPQIERLSPMFGMNNTIAGLGQ